MINRKYLEDAKMRVLASLGSMTPEQTQPPATGFPMQIAGAYGPGQMIQTPREQQAIEYQLRGEAAPQPTGLPVPPQPTQVQPSQSQTVDEERARSRVKLQKEQDAQRIREQEEARRIIEEGRETPEEKMQRIMRQRRISGV